MVFGFSTTAEEVTAGLDLTGRTYLITGVNSGLGRETARVLGLRGARIVGLARTEAKAVAALEALGVPGQGVACELGDLDSVAVAAAAVDGPLHGIVANAGVMALPELQLIHGIEAQFFTNHLGHFKLVTQLLDRLTPDGRVVMVSSGALRMAPVSGIALDDLACAEGYDPWQAYGQSKLANLLFARGLSRRLPPGQTANALHPGVIDTQLGRHVPDKEAMYARMLPQMKTVGQGAATQCYVATHRSLAKDSGNYFSDCQRARPRHAQAKNDELVEALWARSMDLVG